MGQVRSTQRCRGYRSRLAAVLMVPVAVLGLSACGGNADAEAAKIIADKGTPFADLLVPKVTASVTDKAVGVAVDAPVTVTAEDGVLDSVTMVNEYGAVVDGKLSPDGLTWSTTEPLGYNKRYTMNAKSLGLGGVTSRQMTFQTHSPQNLTMPYVMPRDGEVVGVGQ
ncbi:MAG: Ig-like domain-containing protein, partial [Actinomycetota bacterium]|nr:Ig-like domain-containing protein [Actinomycetota bacterium]